MTGNDVLEPRYLKHGLRQELVIQGQVTDAFFFLVEVSILQWVLLPPVMPVVAENLGFKTGVLLTAYGQSDVPASRRCISCKLCTKWRTMHGKPVRLLLVSI